MKRNKLIRNRSNSIVSREFDWVLFLLTLGIAALGIVVIYSATRDLDTNSNVIVQSCAYCLGVAIMMIL